MKGSWARAMKVLKVGAAALVVAATLAVVPGSAPASTPTVTEYQLPASSSPGDLTLGPDGRTWFAETTGVAAITPGGTITQYPLPFAAGGIETASDGGLWTSGAGKFWHLTVAGAATGYTLPPGDPVVGDRIGGMVAGPDGNLWYTR